MEDSTEPKSKLVFYAFIMNNKVLLYIVFVGHLRRAASF